MNEKKPGRPRVHETSNEQEAEIIATYQRLRSRRKTSLKLSLPESVVQRVLREHKISMPSRGRPTENAGDSSGRLICWLAHLNEISYDDAAQELKTDIYRARAAVYQYKQSLSPNAQFMLTRRNALKKPYDLRRSMYTSKLLYDQPLALQRLEFHEKNLTKK